MNSIARKTLYVVLAFATLRCGTTDEPNPQPVEPSIVDFSPKSAGPGSLVNITGSNFSTDAGKNIVKFNGLEALVTSATSNTLGVTVPDGNVTGYISVTLNGLTVTSSATFQGTPEVSHFVPKTGPAGTVVILTGINFSPTLANNLVAFNGTSATVTSATTTQLKVVVPAGTTAGPISVTVGSATVTTADAFIPGCKLLTIETNTSFATRTTTYEFNASNQVIKSTIVGSNASLSTYTYDANGRITSTTTTTNGVATTRTYVYDEQNRVASIISGSTIFAHLYNEHGQLVKVQTSPTNYTEYVYPNTTTSGYTTETVVSGTSSSSNYYEYDDKKNPSRDLFPSFNFIPENNWTKQTQGTLVVNSTFTYNAQGYPLTATWSGGATGTFTYTYVCD